jgi:acyl-CoA synthetase (NDP forming)
MVARLRCAPLMTGWRGSPPLDLSALLDVVVAVSDLITESPDIAEFELNPVRVGRSGAVAVDAVMICSGATGENAE